MSNSEACRQVGVNRRTGTRWRYGRVVTSSSGEQLEYPPVHQPEPEESGRYLSETDRYAIADGLRDGQTLTAIAGSLGRSASTVSREVARNSDPATGKYLAGRAERLARSRRPRPKPRKLAVNEQLRDQVRTGIAKRWSPEQISNRLVVDYPDDDTMRVSPETIYQSLYNPDETGLSRDLAPKLRTGRRCRRKQRRGDERRTRTVDPDLLIEHRPDEIDDRETPGHWEGDLIVGQRNQSAIGTLVERTSRFTKLVRMNGRDTAPEFAQSLIDAYQDLPEWLCGSLTWDQGSELADHATFTESTGIDVWFCEPRSPWQRGTNENTNGLLRQYFPNTATSASTPTRISPLSNTNSTIGPANALDGKPRPKDSLPSPRHILLRRPPETA